MLNAQFVEIALPDSANLYTGSIQEDNSIELIGCIGNNGVFIRIYDDGQYETNIFTPPRKTIGLG